MKTALSIPDEVSEQAELRAELPAEADPFADVAARRILERVEW